MEKGYGYELSSAPKNFPKCLSECCEVRNSCLHALVAEAVSEKDSLLWVYSKKMIQPQEGKDCKCFLDPSTLRVARGFRKALGTIQANKLSEAKRAIMNMTSYRTYYRMLKGEITISPDQQRQIETILTSLGAQTPIVFDKYEQAPPW